MFAVPVVAPATALAITAAALGLAALMAFHRSGQGREITVQPFDLLVDQLFDGIDEFRIALGYQA